MPHPWKHSRPGWIRLWATSSSLRLQGGWTKWPLKVSSNPNYCMIDSTLQTFNLQRCTPGYCCGEDGLSCPAFQILLRFKYTLLILISNSCHSIALVLLNLLRVLNRKLFKRFQSCLLWNRSVYPVTRGNLLFCVLLWVWALRSFSILTLRHHLSNLVGDPSKFAKVLQHCCLRLSSTQKRHCLGKACTGCALWEHKPQWD